MDKLRSMLIDHEAVRLLPYTDTEGVLTIGVGHNLNTPISRDAAMLILDDDIRIATIALNTNYPPYQELDAVRQAVLIDMTFNMGWPRLSGFVKMLLALTRHDYAGAAAEMMDSKWAAQVGQRAVTLSRMMKTGQWQ